MSFDSLLCYIFLVGCFTRAPDNFQASLLGYMAQMLALGFNSWVDKPCYWRKTLLGVGGTRTKVLAEIWRQSFFFQIQVVSEQYKTLRFLYWTKNRSRQLSITKSTVFASNILITIFACRFICVLDSFQAKLLGRIAQSGFDCWA